MKYPGTISPLHRIAVAAWLVLGLVGASEAAATHARVLGSLDAPWASHLREVDDALARRNVGAAVRASHDAYLAALGTRRWEGMVEVGDAYLRIGAASGSRKSAEAQARQIYLYALLRARNLRSVDGALRTAEAFAALNDREASDQCIRVAERLAAQLRDADAQQRVQALAARLADRFLAADSLP